MEKENQMCIKCNNKSFSSTIPFCINCIDNNFIIEKHSEIINFEVNVNNTTICYCGSPNAKKCVLQSCKKCCDVKNCIAHTENKKKFTFSKCFMCDNLEQQLNYYYISKYNIIVSYCTNCYTKHKNILNYLIFNNSTSTQRQKLKIPFNETKEEKKLRCDAIKKNKEKNIKNQKKKTETKEIEKNLKLFNGDIKDGPITSEIVKKHIKLLSKIAHVIVDDEYFIFKCTCDNLCLLEEIYLCNHCDIYKCIDCIASSESICEKDDCDCVINLCANTKCKCVECATKIIDEYFKNNKDGKITSSIMISEKIEINDFGKKYCSKIFTCDLCKEDVNLTNEKISKCTNCKQYFCIGCGILYHENKYLFLVDDDPEIDFLCNNCFEVNEKNKRKNKNIKIDNSDKVTIKPKSFKKLETDTIAENKNEECVVCYTNKKMYACVPCGHLCLCYECKVNIKDKCPLCNEVVDNIYKIF